MEPIALARQPNLDDLMVCYPGDPTGTTPLPITSRAGHGKYAGVHNACGGFLDVISVSEKENVIKCRSCDREIVQIPTSVDTYGKLRSHFQRK